MESTREEEEAKRIKAEKSIREVIDLVHDFSVYYLPCTEPEEKPRSYETWKGEKNIQKRQRRQAGEFLHIANNKFQNRRWMLLHILAQHNGDLSELLRTVIRNLDTYRIPLHFNEENEEEVGNYALRQLFFLGQIPNRSISIPVLARLLWKFRLHVWLDAREFHPAEVNLNNESVWKHFREEGFGQKPRLACWMKGDYNGGGISPFEEPEQSLVTARGSRIDPLLDTIQEKFPRFAGAPAYLLLAIFFLKKEIDRECKKGKLFRETTFAYDQRMKIHDSLPDYIRLSESITDGDLVSSIQDRLLFLKKEREEIVARSVQDYFNAHGV